MSQERNCAFQYAKTTGSFFPSTEITCDQTSLTLDEAKELWNKYYPDAAKHIYGGNTVEMVIWVNMETPQSYGDSLEYISSDSESDGVTIWQTVKQTFIKSFSI